MILPELHSTRDVLSLIPSLLFIALAYTALSFVRTSLFSPLSKYPGPKLASCSRLWKFRVATSKKQHLMYLEAHKKYGPVFRDGPDSLSFWEPAAIKRIYGIGRASFPRADIFPKLGLSEDHPPIFLATEAMAHQKAKRQVGAAYSMSSILQMEQHIDGMVSIWKQGLDMAAQKGRPFDLSRWTNFLTMDIITDLAFGQAFGFLKRGEDVNGIMEAFQSINVLFAFMRLVPFIEKIFFSPIVQKLAPMPEDKGIGYAQKMAQSITDTRYSKFSDNRDLINAIINSKDAEGNPTHRDQVQGEVMSTLIAGGDTTASSILGTIGFLLTTPHALQRLCAEIDSFDSQGLLSPDIPTFAEAQQLPYLGACIDESLRLSPAIPNTFERRTPPGGSVEVVEGVEVPGWTTVGINNWVMGRHKGLYGDDAEVFRPERWLECSEAERKRMKDHEFCFGHGARICAGRNLALVELYKCVLEIFRKYDLKPADPNRLWKEEAKLFLYKLDMMIYISKREMKGRTSNLK